METQRELGFWAHINTKTGDTLKVYVVMDTKADADVVNTELAKKLKRDFKVPWGKPNSHYKVMGGANLVPEGSILIDLEVSSRDLDHKLPRRLKVELNAEITETPLPADIVLGWPTLRSTGLLQAVMQHSEDSVDLPEDDSVEFDELDFDTGDVILPTLDGISSPSLKKICKEAIEEYRHLFAPPKRGGSKLKTLHIDVDPEKAAKYRPDKARNCSPSVLDDIRFDIDKRLEHGFLERGCSPFASAIVAVKQGKPRRRICGDYRKINQITVPLSYPCRNVTAEIDRMRGATIFANFDFKWGYYQVPLSEESQKLLAIVTPDGQFLPKTAPFGPSQVPAHFQMCMNEQVLAGLIGKGVSSYIDDTALYAKTEEEFGKLLRTFFAQCDKYDLRLNGSKCTLGTPSIKFLGMEVDGKGIKHLDERKRAITEMPVPQTQKQLYSFLGMIGFFRKHIQDFSRKVIALTRLTRGQLTPQQFQTRWNETDQPQKAFDRIKQDILNVKMLTFIDYSKPVQVRTDASQDGCGAVMYQTSHGEELPIAYLSKTFNDTERRWATVEQEAFAIYYALTTWSDYLIGHPVEVESDHRNLLWMFRSQSPKIIRWRLRLQEFNFSIRHVPGKDNVVADGLSRVHRMPTAANCASIGSMASLSVLLATNVSQAEQIFIPDKSTLELIANFHNDVKGHCRARAIERQMLELGYKVEKLRDHTEYFVQNCGLCQKLKWGSTLATHPVSISASEVGEEWSVDTIGELDTDEFGNKYIIAAICGFSRICFIRAVKSTGAEEAAHFLMELSGIFGPPSFFRTDNGSQYDNHLVDALLALIGTERYPGIPYRPQSNGMIERLNKEVMQHLRFIVHTRRVRESWSRYLPLVQRIINNSYNSSIGTSPAKLVFGNRVNLDRNLVPHSSQKAQAILDSVTDKERKLDVKKYVEELTEAQCIIDFASRQWQADNIASKSEQTTPQAGLLADEWVTAQWPHKPLVMKRPEKLSVLWKGPFKVLGLKPGSTSVYQCQDPADLKVYEFHITTLRRFHGDLADPKRLIALDKEEFVVDKIIDHNMPSRKQASWDFKVKWKDLPSPEEDSWIPWREAKKLEAMDRYRESHPELRIPSS